MELKKPLVPAMRELEDRIQEIYKTERRVKELKDSLDILVSKIAEQCDGEESKVGAMQYLYWCVEEVKATSIMRVLGVKNISQVADKLGKVTAELACDRCGNLLSFTSRASLKESRRGGGWAEGYTVVCDSCKEEIYLERHEGWEMLEQTKRARLYQLKTMPYGEYLKTPEWQETREWHVKSVSYKCQICNSANKKLHVHHRTYEKTGEEFHRDLTVLCEDCHKLYHSQDS